MISTNRHLLGHSQQWKNQNNVSNLFKVKKKAPERDLWHCSGIFIVNFEHVSLVVLVFPLLILSNYMPTGYMLHPVLIKFDTVSVSHCVRNILNKSSIWHLLVQSQQWKDQNNVLNLFIVNKKRHQNDANDIVLVYLLLTLNIFHTLFCCSHCWLLNK